MIDKVQKLELELDLKSVDEWTKWLDENHANSKAIWLKIMKAGSKKPGIRLEEAVIQAIRYGWIDGKMKRLDSESYILRFSPRKPDSVWSKINRDRAEELMKSDKITKAGMEAIKHGKESGLWDIAYSSKEDPVIPFELQEALTADCIANINFSNWTNSEKVQAVYWIWQCKKNETRKKRIDILIAAAHDNVKFKEMIDRMREAGKNGS